MSRPLRWSLIALAGLAVLAGAVVWALPEIVRRVVLDQIPKRTGRAVAIGDIDLNLLTGRLALKDVRLADLDGPTPFVAFERLDVALSPLELLWSHVHLAEIALTGPSVRIVRTGSAEFNFSDLLGAPKAPAEEPRPSRRWTVAVERLNITRGRVEVVDRAVTPPAQWLVQDLGFEVAGLTTRADAPPGRLALRLRLNEATLALDADPVRIEPPIVRGRVAIDGFDMRWLNPYVLEPLGAPYRQAGGRLKVALTSELNSDAGEVRRAVVSGTISLDAGGLVEPGRPDPFLAVSRVAVEIKEADMIARTLTVGSVAIEGLDLKVRRDPYGVIDLAEIFGSGDRAPRPAAPGSGASPGSPGPAVTPSPPAPPAAATPPRRTLFPIIQGLVRGFLLTRVERATLAPSTVRFVDERVVPTTRLVLSQLQARIDDFTWPVQGPATVLVSTGLPGGGRLEVKGPVTVQPFDAELAMALRDAPVAPYQAYIPITARLSGRFSGDSRSRIALRDGVLVARSKGSSWAQNVEIREPGAERAAIRVERMELRGIDFDWPRRAAAVAVTFRRPRVELERSADGSFNLRRMFVPGPPGSAAPPEAASASAAAPGAPRPPGAAAPPEAASAAAAAPGAPPPGGPHETMRLEFGKVRIEDGVVRFLDRTTQPAFSQDLSRLELTVTDFGNRPDRPAQLVLQSIVGGDAGLDIRGEIGALGAPARIDLVGELRNFKLASVDPYMAAKVGWVIRKGDLQYRVRFKLDGNQLAADNELVVDQLQVAPAGGSDEVKRRIGLPLGLIVALIKDQQGEIHATIPVAGAVNDPKVGLGEMIWTAVKNVLVNVVTAPFKAIGGLFSGGGKVEEPTVDPVTFAPGSAVLSPAMEEHLLKVADFLRRAPFVSLVMTSVAAAGDAEALRDEAAAARLREFQKERGLEAAAAALAAYFAERLPDVPRPATVPEQVALLRAREPAPTASLADLRRRRLEATRERLVSAEGIPPARLAATDAPPAASPAPAGDGRVEFAVVARE